MKLSTTLTAALLLLALGQLRLNWPGRSLQLAPLQQERPKLRRGPGAAE